MKMDRIIKIYIVMSFFALPFQAAFSQTESQRAMLKENDIRIDLIVPDMILELRHLTIRELETLKGNATLSKVQPLSSKYRTEVLEDGNGRIYYRQFQFAGEDYWLRFDSIEDFKKFKGKVSLIRDAQSPIGFEITLDFFGKEAETVLQRLKWEKIPGMKNEQDVAYRFQDRILVYSEIPSHDGTVAIQATVYESLAKVLQREIFEGVGQSVSGESPLVHGESRNEVRRFISPLGKSRVTIIGELEFNHLKKLPTTSVLQELMEGDRVNYQLEGGRILFADGLFLDEGQTYLIFESKEDYEAYLNSFPKAYAEGTIFSNTFLEDPQWTFEPGKAGKQLEEKFSLESGTLNCTESSLEMLDLVVNEFIPTPHFVETIFPLVAVYCGEVMAKGKDVELILQWNKENNAFIPMIRFPALNRSQHYSHLIWEGLNSLGRETFSTASIPMIVAAMAKQGEQ